MLLGLLPAFKRCGPTAAITSWAVGLLVFFVTRYVVDGQIAALAKDKATAIQVGGPVVCSLIVFVLIGLIRPWHNDESDALVDALGQDPDEVDERSLQVGHV
jgi:SSS family solute:Na+ symporter